MKKFKTCFDDINSTIEQLLSQKEELIKRELLENTNIKTPITPGKIRYHGIKLCSKQSKPNTFWLEQRGKRIGKIFKQNIGY